MARLRSPRGTEDLLPERIPCLEHVFGACRRVLELHGYGEIRTPLFEETALFSRSLGETADVVEKEMFTVVRGDTNISFRPEGTAPVVRSYLEHNLDKVRPFQKFYYVGPMFRFERPQAGRSRQFYQVGIEALGSTSPLLDAEVVLVVHRCFSEMGLKNYQVHINSIGDRVDRDRFRDVLRVHMEQFLTERCDDCQKRYQRNVFRMLDCKIAGCQPSNKSAPHFIDHLRPESRQRFDATVALLEKLAVPIEVDHSIVRGFDYYTHMVFEVRCSDLGARDAVCGGGRYDHLIPDMGGPELGAVGFAIGITPILLALEVQKHPALQPQEPSQPIFVVPVSDEQREDAFLLTDRLRLAGLQAETDYEGRSVRALFKAAPKRGVRLMLVLGPEEVHNKSVQVRDLDHSQDLTLPTNDELAEELRKLLVQ